MMTNPTKFVPTNPTLGRANSCRDESRGLPDRKRIYKRATVPAQIPNRAADSHEIRPLTGVRGFAAAAVVFLHFHPAWSVLLPFLGSWGAVAMHGGLGVDLFFMLSGFILSYVYCAGDRTLGWAGYRHFLWARLARIFPNHLAMVLVFLALVVVTTLCHHPLHGPYPFSQLPAQFAMTEAWIYTPALTWNYPSWSVSVEWLAYLCVFPVAWHLLRLPVGAVASMTIGYALLGCWCALSAHRGPFWADTMVAVEFLVGALFYQVHRQSARLTRVCQRGASAVFALLAALWFCPVGPWQTTLMIFLFPPLLLGLTSDRSAVGGLLSTPVALWFGRTSYALYMSHAAAQRILKTALPAERFAGASPGLRAAVFLVNVLFILGGMAALYYLVEVPARNWMRRFGRRWSPQRAKPPVAARAAV